MLSRWPVAPHPGKGQASGRLPVEVCTGRRPPHGHSGARASPSWVAQSGRPGLGQHGGKRPRTRRGCGWGCAHSVGVQRISVTLKRASIGELRLCSPGHAPQEWGHGGKAAVLARSSCSTRARRGRFRGVGGVPPLPTAGRGEEGAPRAGWPLGRGAPPGSGPCARGQAGGSAPRATGRGGLAVSPRRPTSRSRGAQRTEPRRPPPAHAEPRPPLATPRPRLPLAHSPPGHGPAPLRATRPLPRGGRSGPGAGQLFLSLLTTNLLPSSVFWKGVKGSPGNFSHRRQGNRRQLKPGRGRLEPWGPVSTPSLRLCPCLAIYRSTISLTY